MKKTLMIALVACIGFCILSAPVIASAKKPTYKLKLSCTVPPTDPNAQQFMKFAELVEKYSEGDVKVTVFHSSQLGTGKETFEAARRGFIDIATDSYANLVSLTPAFEALHLPFIFESREQYLKAHKSPKVHDRMNQELSKIGLKWLTFSELSPRQFITTDRKIETPADMKGLKWRTSRSPLEIAMINGFGAQAMSIDWMEAIDSMRTGMVQGVTVVANVPYMVKLFDLLKFVGIINAESFGHIGLVSEKKWNSWPKNVQDILQKSADEAEDWHSARYYAHVNDEIKKGKEKGVTYYGYTAEQREVFMKIAREIWKNYESTTCPPDLVELIRKEAGPAGDPSWGLVY